MRRGHPPPAGKRAGRRPGAGRRPSAEPLVVRPTSETIIGDSFSKWVSSYRDLPMLINQWANVVRWEMRTRIFLRTSEFLWQEGHTAHATAEEAVERTRMMLDVYARFAEEYLAMPVIRGRKTASERFPGAVDTLCIEAMMQDRKALQAGHLPFSGPELRPGVGNQVPDRRRNRGIRLDHLLGRLHPADRRPDHDPRRRRRPDPAAPGGLGPCGAAADRPARTRTGHGSWRTPRKSPPNCGATAYHGRNLGVEIDDRDIGGARGWDWIKKGIPLRVEIGPRDMAEDAVFVGRRDKGHREKTSMQRADVRRRRHRACWTRFRSSCFDRALALPGRPYRVHRRSSRSSTTFSPPKTRKSPEIHGGFAHEPLVRRRGCEAKIKEDLNVTIRCIPLDGETEDGRCICCGQPSSRAGGFRQSLLTGTR